MDCLYRQRKPMRLKDYDYSQEGYYFVTICTVDRLNLFGKIVGADDPVRLPTMEPNGLGEIVHECWNKINEIYSNVQTENFCLMPNHIHGIIVIGEIGGQSRPPLHKIIQGFKSITTRMSFKYGFRVIWQRGYYEHIIRNEQELNEIREYILNNPLKWSEDKYYISE